MATIAEILKKFDIDDHELKAYAAMLETDTATFKRFFKEIYYLQEVEEVNDDLDQFFLDATDVYVEDNYRRNEGMHDQDWLESSYRKERVNRARSLFEKYNR